MNSAKKGGREPEVSLVKLQNLVMEDDSEISHHVGWHVIFGGLPLQHSFTIRQIATLLSSFFNFCLYIFSVQKEVRFWKLQTQHPITR